MLWMIWFVTAVAALAAIVALLMLMLVKRTPNVRELGCVSNRWIADHNVDWL